MNRLTPILQTFNLPPQTYRPEPIVQGHINDTFRIRAASGAPPGDFLLQRINHLVFKNPIQLTENIRRVTEHIRAQYAAQEVENLDRRALTLLPTTSGSYCHQDSEGNFWRLYRFIGDTVSYDQLDSPRQAHDGAQAFGEFIALLANLPGPPLHETIPHFHDGPKRYRDFLAVLEADPVNRVAQTRDEIEFLQGQAGTFELLPREAAQGHIPLRSTHNDTKINNILFDRETSAPLCVVDLDTVMPGYSLYDFGDLVRTGTTGEAEDEPDLNRIALRLPLFEAMVRGFLTGAGAVLTPAEMDLLVHGGKLMALIMGCRFLTDHLAGDVYYKTHRPNHNLDRCRSQFQLVRSMLEQQDRLEETVSVVRCELGLG